MVRVAVSGIRAVAAHAGVSVSTVSRVINGGPYVTAAVRDKVEASMRAVNYEPHALAQSLRTGQTQSVGYLISDIANPLFATIARGIDDELQRHGYTMLLASARGGAQGDLAMMRQLLRRRVDGLILSLADETDQALHAYLRELAVPIVLLDRDVVDTAADRVLVDHAGGIRVALEHLAALGHRRVALITGQPQIRPGYAIRSAFIATAAALGLNTDPADIVTVPFDGVLHAADLNQILDRPDPVTALIAGGAQLSVAVLRAVRARGLRLPDELSIVAYDDTDVTALFSPPITVVGRDIYAIGGQAAQLLLTRLLNPAAREPQTVIAPTSLIVRGSTARPTVRTT